MLNNALNQACASCYLRQGGHAFIGVSVVSLFVCWQDYTKITQVIDFHKIQWKGGTRATEETVRFFCGNPDHVTFNFFTVTVGFL